MIKTTKEIMDVQFGLKMDKTKSYGLEKVWVDRDELIKLIHRVCLQTGAEVTEQHLRLHLGVDE